LFNVGVSPEEGAIPVLVVGPMDSRRWMLRNIFAPPQWEIREADSLGDAITVLDSQAVAVAICDTDLPDGTWQTLLGHIQATPNPANLIVSSRLADEHLWAEVLNLGGYDVLAQPFDCSEVRRAAHMAWTAWRLRCQVVPAPKSSVLRAGTGC